MIKHLSFSLFLISTTSWAMNQITPKVQSVRDAGSWEKYLLMQWRRSGNPNIGLPDKDINTILKLVDIKDQRHQQWKRKKDNRAKDRALYLNLSRNVCPSLFYGSVFLFAIGTISSSGDFPTVNYVATLGSGASFLGSVIMVVWMSKRFADFKNL